MQAAGPANSHVTDCFRYAARSGRSEICAVRARQCRGQHRSIAAGPPDGQSPWIERLGRAGLVAKATSHAVIGILAIKVAVGARAEDRTGRRLRAIAEQPLGELL